jgi:hypothetical protein
MRQEFENHEAEARRMGEVCLRWARSSRDDALVSDRDQTTQTPAQSRTNSHGSRSRAVWSIWPKLNTCSFEKFTAIHAIHDTSSSDPSSHARVADY